MPAGGCERPPPTVVCALGHTCKLPRAPRESLTTPDPSSRRQHINGTLSPLLRPRKSLLCCCWLSYELPRPGGLEMAFPRTVFRKGCPLAVRLSAGLLRLQLPARPGSSVLGQPPRSGVGDRRGICPPGSRHNTPGSWFREDWLCVSRKMFSSLVRRVFQKRVERRDF